MSFAAVLLQVKAALDNNVALAAFASTKWGAALTVKIVWRNREEVASSDLPLIMITRPTVRRSRNTYRRIDAASSVRLYAGFYQMDEELRQLELIEFEEAILDALQADSTLAGMVNSMSPADGANDEGALGEVCFTVQEIEITTNT